MRAILEMLGFIGAMAFLPVTPVALAVTVWYLFSRSALAAKSFAVILWTVVVLNLMMMGSKFWYEVMIRSFNADGLAKYNKFFLPTTILVLVARPLRSLIGRRAG